LLGWDHLLVDHDDPENRIAELERQLADQKHVAGPEHLDGRPVVTPEDGHNVTFSKAAGSRGYHEDQVDAFLDRVAAARRDPTARDGVTQTDLHNVAFSKPPFGTTGYNKDEVDAYLYLVRIEFGLAPKAGLRHRLQVERGMVKVLDPDGVPWTVYRRWFPNWKLHSFGNPDPGEIGAYLLAVLWPPWFIAKWLGVPWVILIERNGSEIGDERVRGWRESQRRIQEIAESAAAGTL
jgi:DivIVA domain-containing protein